MIERPDADALLAGPLGRWLTDQNAARAQAKTSARRRQYIAVIGAMMVAVVTLLTSDWNIGLALQLGLFAGAGGFGWARLARRPVIQRLKGGINGAIAEALGLQFAAETSPGKSFE